MKESLNGNWELSVFSVGEKSFEEIFGQRRPQIHFDISKQSITGTTGCNHLRGSYTARNGELRFGDGFITTKMACAGYEESTFLNALSLVNRFSAGNNELRLFHGSTAIMSFVKK